MWHLWDPGHLGRVGGTRVLGRLVDGTVMLSHEFAFGVGTIGEHPVVGAVAAAVSQPPRAWWLREGSGAHTAVGQRQKWEGCAYENPGRCLGPPEVRVKCAA